MKRLIYSFAALLALSGCIIDRSGENPEETQRVTVRFDRDYVAGDTKSSVIPESAEAEESGGVVAFYDAATGRLDSQYRVDDFSGPFSIVLPEKRMNVYVLGNMWLLDEENLTHEPVFPEDERDVAGMVYEFGGVDAGGGLHTETFADMGRFGIPARGQGGFSVAAGAVINVSLKRIFAKVRITVDHSGMSSEDGQFRNVKLYFRQANAVQTPFAKDGSKASSPGDLLAVSDYESPMQDGAEMGYSFYLPENRQISPDPDLATYVEFTAEVDKNAGGFGGGVTYRFYLGKESGADNDLEGNTWYDILLSFNVGSLFDPTWRVNPGDDFSDDRLFCVMKDAACNSVLGEQDVVVRAGRPGKVYVYMNKTGVKGLNHLAGKQMSESFVASALDDCAWYGDFAALAAYGITASWDAPAGRLFLSVTDGSKFIPGMRIPVTLHLLPGEKTVVMNVMTAEDQALVMDGSEFYMGMKRSATVRGFSGSSLTVRAADASHSQLLRLSGDSAGPFVGTLGLPMSGRSVDLYAFGASESSPVKLVFESDDEFNDDTLETEFCIWKPVFRQENKVLTLLLDGTGVRVDYGFNDRNGVPMNEGAFDPGLYRELLAAKATWSNDIGDRYAGFGDGEFYIDYLGHEGGEDWIEDLINVSSSNNANVDVLGSATLKPLSPLYSGNSAYSFKVYCPFYLRDFPSSIQTDYLNEYRDSEIDLNAEFGSYGNKVDLTAETSSGKTLTCVRQVPVSKDFVRFELHQGEVVDLTAIPGGVTVFRASITNPRVTDGDKVMDWRSMVTVFHRMTIAPFGIFREGSPVLAVYLTYPKAAWMLRKYHSGETDDVPNWNTAGEMDLYDKYLFFSRMQTTAPDYQTTYSSIGNKIPVMYCDLFPSEYPEQSNFTPETAVVAAGKTWLTDVCFKAGGNTLGQPLSSAFLSGNSYYSITTSATAIGWVFSYK